MNYKNICIFGAGYVGYSLSLLFGKSRSVSLIEIDQQKVELINEGNFFSHDDEYKNFTQQHNPDIQAFPALTLAPNPDLIIVATPTDYDSNIDSFDVSSVTKCVKLASNNFPNAPIIIKSTVPIGFTQAIREELGSNNIYFSPEFLREGSALDDLLHPSRIVVGGVGGAAKPFAELLIEESEEVDVPILFTQPNEAEAIKLFANTYLAMRVAFFNELDSFSMINQLKTQDIIDGICLDSRIGNYYNNPSFGYGGYCLPKDTQQLAANYKNTPHKLIKAIDESNEARINFIVGEIQALSPSILGVHRLTMKKDSDNFRTSSIIRVMRALASKDLKIIVYEPLLLTNKIDDAQVTTDLEYFKSITDVIIANRGHEELLDVSKKVFTRDIFNSE